MLILSEQVDSCCVTGMHFICLFAARYLQDVR